MNRKSFVTLLLALIMLFACAAAVAEYDTHVTLTGTAYGLTAGTTYTDDPLYDYISEKFNLDWDPWIVENKSHNEKIRIWTSSDSMPDVALWRSINMAEYMSYVDQELIAPLPDGWKESYPHLAKAIAKSGLEEKMTSVIGDIRNMAALKAAYDVAQPEIVLHLAAQPIVRDSYRDPAYT